MYLIYKFYDCDKDKNYSPTERFSVPGYHLCIQ